MCSVGVGSPLHSISRKVQNTAGRLSLVYVNRQIIVRRRFNNVELYTKLISIWSLKYSMLPLWFAASGSSYFNLYVYVSCCSRKINVAPSWQISFNLELINTLNCFYALIARDRSFVCILYIIKFNTFAKVLSILRLLIVCYILIIVVVLPFWTVGFQIHVLQLQTMLERLQLSGLIVPLVFK